MRCRRLPIAIFVLVAGGALGVAGCRAPATASDTAFIDASADPEQGPADGVGKITRTSGAWKLTLTPLASYSLRGVVVATESYGLGWQADLAPIDVAMVWGPLAANGLWKQLDWSQSNRWYFWHYGPDFGHDNAFVARSSSNTHVIPANSRLESALHTLAAGDLAELQGLLVRVDGRDSQGATVWWVSSTTRTDTGDGSCEVLYLTRLRAHHKIWE